MQSWAWVAGGGFRIPGEAGKTSKAGPRVRAGRGGPPQGGRGSEGLVAVRTEVTGG